MGAVVAAFQLRNAVDDGMLDASHPICTYWYGKNKATSLFGSEPVFGGSASRMPSWFQEGGGDELFRKLPQDVMGLEVMSFPVFPMPAQPFGWIRGKVGTLADPQGFRFRTLGLAAMLAALRSGLRQRHPLRGRLPWHPDLDLAPADRRCRGHQCLDRAPLRLRSCPG
ncbi:hypothetical protein [Rhodovulum sp. MB263]|uniref:hypothetical protein n=1 Tax=Rhodovulum sp. (strain MB263) TaxID=308754 RepID=UPI001E2BEBA5|nr:hypothetical protein [Rhodovulum sp. MB263]